MAFSFSFFLFFEEEVTFVPLTGDGKHTGDSDHQHARALNVPRPCCAFACAFRRPGFHRRQKADVL